MRAVVRTFISDIAPCQAVFAVRSSAGEMTFAEVEREITELLHKSGLIRNRDGKKED